MSQEEVITVKIFDWTIHRIMRNEQKEIVKIILQKNGKYKEYFLS